MKHLLNCIGRKHESDVKQEFFFHNHSSVSTLDKEMTSLSIQCFLYNTKSQDTLSNYYIMTLVDRNQTAPIMRKHLATLEKEKVSFNQVLHPTETSCSWYRGYTGLDLLFKIKQSWHLPWPDSVKCKTISPRQWRGSASHNGMSAVYTVGLIRDILLFFLIGWIKKILST